MKQKMLVKMLIDCMMTLLLLLLMAKQLTGDTAHEWLGAGMFVLWLAHHLVNLNWHRGLVKGNYSLFRRIQLAVNLLLFLAMIGTMASGIVLSREVFAFLPISGGLSWARPLHVLSAFWGFVLMVVHLGMHWTVILGLVRKKTGPVKKKTVRLLLSLAGGGVAVYGLYALLKNQIFSYLFLASSFVFFDFERPVLLFFTEYLAIMGLFIFLSHYGLKLLRKLMPAKHNAQLPKKH